MLHLKIMRGIRGIPVVCVVIQHAMLAHVSSGYCAYLNLDKVIARAPIVDAKTSLCQTQDWLDQKYTKH